MDKKPEKDYSLVALIVPVHNNKEDTVEFLESLKGVMYPNYKIIIIDDGSTDATEDIIKEKYPYVILLKGDGNLWWSRAMNIGIEKAIEIGADYVLLGDNDAIVDSEWISALVDTAEKKPKSIVTSKVYYYDNPKRIFYAGGEINWLGEFKIIGSGKMDNELYNVQRDVKWSGCSGTLIKTAFFKDIGLMDYKNFPLYWADLDFTYRAYKKGYRIIYEPKSMMWHNVSSTVKKRVPNISSFLSAFFYLTTNIRSHQNFRVITKFYLKHYPIYLVPYTLLKYALLIILQSMRYSSFFREEIDRVRRIHR